jgi:hypothetical protein
MYVMDILHREGMSKCKPVDILMSTSEKLSAHVVEALGPQDATSYRSIVGGLQYLTLTLPNLAFAVNKVYQILQAPTIMHLTYVKRISRYVRGTIHMRL